jgi:ribonucleoside-diphosphate reductase alpha chain
MQNVQHPTAEVDSRTHEHGTVKRGLRFERFFTKQGVHPFDEVEWERRTAMISNDRGEKIFEQKDTSMAN